MSDQLTLAAEARERVGKGASRLLRRQGRVPAVIYGQNQTPAAVHLEEKALVRALSTGHFMNTVVTVGGVRTLPKDVAFDVVTDRPLHVDFLRIGEHSTVTVAVPVVFADQEESEGIEAGGVLNVTHHELSLTVDAADIPSELTVSLKGRQVGDAILVSDLSLPAGATAVLDADEPIATIVPPTVPTAADEAADAEVAEAQAAESSDDTETTEAAGEGDADTAEG